MFLGAQLIRTEICEMPHGSYSEITIEKWKVPSGYSMDLRMAAESGYFQYDRDWNCFMQAWEAFRDMRFEDVPSQIIHSEAKDLIGRMIVYRGLKAAFHYLHIYIKWVKSGVPPTDKELSLHKSPD
jgi:hypothetical protein